MAEEELDLDALYAAAPAEFVEERKRLSRALRAAGRRDEAQAVDKLTRPTVSVWATNQLARRERDRVGELLELTDRLRDTQGRGDGAAFAEVAGAHRSVLVMLRGNAERLLSEGGHAPSPQLLGRIVGNLRAGAADPALRAQVAAGRLQRDVEETGFAGLLEAGIAPPSAPAPARPAVNPATAPPAGHDRAARRTEEAQRKADEAVARAAERQRAAAQAQAQRAVEKARQALEAARREVERDIRAVGVARDKLAEREQQLETTRARERQLASALAEAESALAHAR